jgi:hypothetical protein
MNTANIVYNPEKNIAEIRGEKIDVVEHQLNENFFINEISTNEKLSPYKEIITTPSYFVIKDHKQKEISIISNELGNSYSFVLNIRGIDPSLVEKVGFFVSPVIERNKVYKYSLGTFFKLKNDDKIYTIEMPKKNEGKNYRFFLLGEYLIPLSKRKFSKDKITKLKDNLYIYSSFKQDDSLAGLAYNITTKFIDGDESPFVAILDYTTDGVVYEKFTIENKDKVSSMFGGMLFDKKFSFGNIHKLNGGNQYYENELKIKLHSMIKNTILDIKAGSFDKLNLPKAYFILQQYQRLFINKKC